MKRQTIVRSIALVVGWLIAASVVIAVPRADAYVAAAVNDWPSSNSPSPIGAAGSTSGYAVSSFDGAVALLANTPAGTPCTYTDPDTSDEYDGTIEIRQAGRDHNDYDGNGSFHDSDDELAALFAEDFGFDPVTPPGYRYEFEVCVSNVWPYEALSVDWHGAPYELVLAENAVEWFNQVRDAAFEDAFTDKTPGWRTWPDRAHNQIVALDTWLYIENYFGTLSSSKILNASEGDQIQVTVEAVPTHSEWWVKKTGIDQEETFTCDLGGGRGVAWTPGASGDKCELTWDHSSPVIGAIDMRVRLIYDVTIYSQTLNNDDANNDAGQSFSQSIPGHPGQWDVHPDGSVPQDYKLYVSEVLTNGFDRTSDVKLTDGPAAALGATPGGPQIGPSDSCWGPDVRCRVVSAVGGAILDFIVPEEIRSLLQGCWEGAKSAAVGFGDLLSSLNPLTWDDKIAEMNELKNVLLEAHSEGELLDVLTDMGLQAGFDSLRLDVFDTVGDGNLADLDFSNAETWFEWVGTIGCEYLIGVFTGKAQQKINDLLFNTRNRPDSDNDSDSPDNDDDRPNDDDDDRPNDDDDDGPTICLNPIGLDSFPTGTPVLMADGTHREINLVRPGDQVLSYNVSAESWRPQTVTHQWSAVDTGHMSTVTLDDGSVLTATDHHPFWVESDQAWTTTDELAPGDLLLTPDGVVAVGRSVTAAATETLVWELSVSGDHNFTVSTGDHDLLVHNRDPNGCRSVTGETVDDDGNLVLTYDDGTVETFLSDGSTRTTFPDGSMTHVDGAGNTFELDGESGSFSYTDADGNDVPLHLPDGRPVLDSTGRPIGEMTGDFDNPHGIDRAWLDENGNERYPPNNGTIDGERVEFLDEGVVVDRYGPNPNGSYLGDPEGSIDVRGIAPDHNGEPKPLWTYESNVGAEVIVDGDAVPIPPMPVQAGEIAPWNGSPGGATQYRTDADLITRTYGPGTQAGGGSHPLFDQMLSNGYPNNDFWFNISQQG